MNKGQQALNTLREKGYTNHFQPITLEYQYFNEFKILQKLVDKATPKKPYFLNYGGYKIGNWKCPSCDLSVTQDNFCAYCGQQLDWSDKDEEI